MEDDHPWLSTTKRLASNMGKKDKKRSAEEAGLVEVSAGAVSAAGVGMPVADVADVSAMEVDESGIAKKKSKKDKKDKSEKSDKKEKKEKKEKKSKDGAAAAAASTSSSASKSKSKELEKDLEIPADHLSPIAHPLAGKKLAKKTLKTVKKVCVPVRLLSCALLLHDQCLRSCERRNFPTDAPLLLFP